MKPAACEFPLALIGLLQTCEFIVVLTGAGVSAESGVPTFRDAQTGFWSQFDPQELATPQAFQRNPDLVWNWYEWRRELISRAKPNAGHYALVEMERRFPDFILITQNVDSLHQQAGSGKSAELIELHGNIWRNKCFIENAILTKWDETGEAAPRCPRCGGFVRPDVVWFNESLPQVELTRAWQAAQKSQVFFSIGTSGLVQPAASLPYIAQQHGAVVVEINPDTTPLSRDASYVLRGFAGKILPALIEAVWGA